MNNSLKIFITLFCSFLYLSGNTQTIWTALKKCHERMMQDDNVTLVMDVTMVDKNDPSEILDHSVFILVKDREGSYSKIQNLEVLENESFVLTINHQSKWVVVAERGSQSLSWASSIVNPAGLDSLMSGLYNVNTDQNGSDITYRIEDNKTCEVLAELTIDTQQSRFKKVVQHLAPMLIDTTYKTPIVFIEYAYKKAQSRPRFNHIVKRRGDQISLTTAYRDYELIEHQPITLHEKGQTDD